MNKRQKLLLAVTGIVLALNLLSVPWSGYDRYDREYVLRYEWIGHVPPGHRGFTLDWGRLLLQSLAILVLGATGFFLVGGNYHKTK